jgi:hypothetical protein
MQRNATTICTPEPAANESKGVLNEEKSAASLTVTKRQETPGLARVNPKDAPRKQIGECVSVLRAQPCIEVVFGLSFVHRG